MPRGGISRGRFGSYPKAIAAQNVARTFQSPAQAQAERDEFRATLDVLHPRRGPRAPDGPTRPTARRSCAWRTKSRRPGAARMGEN